MRSNISNWAQGLAVTTLLAAFSFAAQAATKVELFSTKPESVATFDKLIAQFEAENPGIDIEQVQLPEPDTVLKTRLVKNRLPDIIAANGNAQYGELARAGVLHDFNGSDRVGRVHEAYIQMVGDLARIEGVYGMPYATNANTVLYNKKLFEERGYQVPETWDAFIDLAEQIKANDETPFYLTLKDAWTAMVPFNALAANLQGEGFIQQRLEGEARFSNHYQEVAKRMKTLLDFGHNDNFGKGYDDGNRAFANGEALMLLQGVWAIPAVTAANPDIEVGVFTLPATNNPAGNKLVSGVDVMFSVSESSRNKEAALAFIDFMMRPENAQLYIDEQKAFSAVKGVIQGDPVFEGIAENFEEGRITSFPDHYFPPGMQAANLVQE